MTPEQSDFTLHIQLVEGGFVITGYFAGAERRCVVNSYPALLKKLRSWWSEVKPTKPVPGPAE